jgi:hypothetical protein
MTSRQLRRLRREEERTAKKAAYKASLRAAATPVSTAPFQPAAPVPPTTCLNPELLDEFTPEFLAYANSMRERVARNVALMKQNTPSSQERGFVSQVAPAKTKSRAEINRANASHSTGPRTPTGKLASSRNSLKHGLASGTLIIPGEDRAAFESLLESLLAEHQPAGIAEEMLLHEMAQSFWLAQRALRFQNECFTENDADDERTGRSLPVVRVDEKRLALFLRYHTTHERAFHKALSALIRLKRAHRARGTQAAGSGSARCARSDMDRLRAEAQQAHGFVPQHDTSPLIETRFVSRTGLSTLVKSRLESQKADLQRLTEAA